MVADRQAGLQTWRSLHMGGARRFRGWWGALALASLLVAALAGCGTSGTAGPPRGVAQPTATPVLPPPTATAYVPTHDVTFTTPDGVRLDGTLYGSGTTGEIGRASCRERG